MSSVSNGGEQPTPPTENTNSNLLHTSNSTSGFFLGRQPRDWESQGLSADKRPRGPLQAFAPAKRPRTSQICVTANTDGADSNADVGPPRPSASTNASDPIVTLDPQVSPATLPRDVLPPRTVPSIAQPNVAYPLTGHHASTFEHSNNTNTAAFNNATPHPSSTIVGLTVGHSYPSPSNGLSPATTTTLHSLHQGNGNVQQAQGHSSTVLRPVTSSHSARYNPVAAAQLDPRTLYVPFPSDATVTAQGPSIRTNARRRLQNFVSPNYVAIFEAKIRMLYATKRPTQAEERRISSIRDAIALSDTLFLLLHQLLCAYTIQPQLLTSVLNLSPAHLDSLRVLNLVWGNHQLLGPEVMSIFCIFPLPLAELHTNRAFYDWIFEVRDYLPILVSRWTLMRRDVFARGCPPFAIEMGEVWGIHYVTAKAFFVHLFHQLYPHPNPDFFKQALALFLESERLSAQYIQNPGARASLPAVINSFNQNFLRLVQQYRPQRIPAPADSGEPSSRPVSELRPAATSQIASTTVNRPSARGQVLYQSSAPRNSQATPAVVSPSMPQISTNASRVLQVQSRPQFLPAQGQTAPIFAQPDPSRSALHQAILFEPQLRDDEGFALSEERKMYAFVENLLIQPRLINNDTVYEYWSVLLPPDLARDRVTTPTASEEHELSARTYFIRDNSALIYLRCIELAASEVVPDETRFSSVAASWPQHIFVSVNGNHLDFRRKGQYGRDLPCDITHLLHEGSNSIELSYHVAAREVGKTYGLGLEIIRIHDHTWALKAPSTIDAQSSLAAMIKLLRQQNQDDDLVMSDPHISIDLVDPISARVVDLPVRGKSCFHRECFDLNSYLKSRLCRNKNGLVYPDEWRCPICKRDARPTSLVVDEFLKEVKEKLIEDGASNARAILVREDGSWQPKVEEAGRSNPTQDTPEKTAKVTDTLFADFTNRPSKADANPPVILLDDD